MDKLLLLKMGRVFFRYQVYIKIILFLLLSWRGSSRESLNFQALGPHY